MCPVTYPNEFDFGVSERTAISRPFANAVPATFAVDRKGWSPCKTACPVHTSAHGYVALVAKGRYEEAYRVASEPNPFPSVCGRICTHVCETECTRGKVEDPIAIAGIKRFVADHGVPAEMPEALPVFYDEPVAIVGGGPAGLTAARELAQFGYKATVFEALPVAGGMLRVGIPEYRLPRPRCRARSTASPPSASSSRPGMRCGTDFTVDSLFADGYKAVFLATGLHQSKDLPIDGLDQQGVVRAVEFLRAQALGETATTGKRVVVVGGGDVAYDAGRTAFRCGADEVTLACIEDERTAPASSEEIEEGKEEQVHVEYSLVPVEILGAGGVATGVKFQRCTLGEPNERGWRPPVPVEGEFVELEADTVIFAVGQAIVDDFLAGADDVSVERGQIQVDTDTMMTGRTGVFAGGDAAAMGPWTAIEAIAAGRRGARAMHNFLRGEQLIPVWDSEADKVKIPHTELDPLEPQARRIMKTLDGVERRTTWEEVRLGFSEEDVRAEAERCLDCAVCSDCKSCVTACPADAIDFDQKAWDEEITVGAVILATGHQEFDATRKLPLGYGRFKNVLTQSQLARLLSASGPTAGELKRPSDGETPKRIFMLQCVGSRDCTSSGNEHCSAICCLFATLHSSLIKQHYPDAEITIGYTDMRTPGKAHEEYYRLVQERGVRYVRGRVGEILEELDGTPHGAHGEHDDRHQERGAVRPRRALRRPRGLRGHAGHRPRRRRADGGRRLHPRVPPQAGSRRHAAHRHVPVRHRAGTQDDPRVDRPGEGGGGPCHQHAEHGLRDDAGAGRLERRGRLRRLRRLRDRLPADGDHHHGRGRRALVRRPQHLPRLRHLRRRVPHGGDAARRLQRRRGAGGGDGLMTASATPSGPRLGGDRTIVAFCCRECAYAAADASANARTPLPPTVRLVLMPCTGRVSPLHLLSALAEGADGVMVAGCLLGQCHYREGNFSAVDRVAFVQRMLKSVGVEPERCRMFTMSAGEPPKFVGRRARDGPRHLRPAAAAAVRPAAPPAAPARAERGAA